jgi:hypothetical protein
LQNSFPALPIFDSPQTPLFAMSKAHLKRGAFSTGEKRPAEAPSFKTIFDWRREKGFGDEFKLKSEQKAFCKVLQLQVR